MMGAGIMNRIDAERALLDIGSVLDAASVPFFLVLGTCLGVVRDGHIITWDRDIDIGVLVENLTAKVNTLVRQFAAAGFRAHIKDAPCDYPRAIVLQRGRVHADIAGFIKNGDERFSPSSRADYAVVYPARIVETTEAVRYLGREGRIPSPPDEYLTIHYGAGWRKPNPAYKPSQGKARVYGYMGSIAN